MDKVSLEKTDTCLTYALKRIGQDPNLCTYENIHEFFNQLNFNKKQGELEVGDLLLWDKEMKWEWMPWRIAEDGKIEWKSVPMSFHFGIYEGDGYFSDCTRLVRPPHPSLRIRRLDELKKNPDWILKLE